MTNAEKLYKYLKEHGVYEEFIALLEAGVITCEK